MLVVVAAVAVGLWVAGMPAPSETNWAALPLLIALLMAATRLVVPFRIGGSVDAVNLVEASLAPLLIAYPPVVVVIVAALTQVVDGLMRRLPPVKIAFNGGMWALAAGLGGAVISQVGQGTVWPTQVLGLLAALVVVGLVNNATLTVVLTLAEGVSLRHLGERLAPVALQGWVGAWTVNVAVGLMFALAFQATPVAATVFVIPILVLHLAYRSYSTARADQARLAAVHSADKHLSSPLEPLASVPDFLREVAQSFDAGSVELVIRAWDGTLDIHRSERATGEYTLRRASEETASLARAITAMPAAGLLTAAGDDAMSRAVAEAGARNVLAAPLLHGDESLGAILIMDRNGFEGSRTGELAVVEALARVTSNAMVKARLLADVADKRHKLAELVDNASGLLLNPMRTAPGQGA